MTAGGGASVNELEQLLGWDERAEKARSAGDRIANRLRSVDGRVRACPIRREFLCRSAPEGTVPPMVTMLRGGTGGRGGQGGEVRLKLYLSMLWFASGDGHSVEWPASHWADLLGLPDRDSKGKRRIQEAFGWLHKNRFVVVAQRPGKHPTVTILHEAGMGLPYTKPGKTATKGGEPTYRQMSNQWWTNGWLAELSGAAIVSWLVYQDESGERSDFVWLTPEQSLLRYGLSVDTRKKGLRELRNVGLVEHKRVRHSEAFSAERSITKYRLVPQRLTDPAPPRIKSLTQNR
jgi:hypothetical protein